MKIQLRSEPAVIRRCDCESSRCHPNADCKGNGTHRTTHSRVCLECAKKMPTQYMVDQVSQF